MNSKQLEQNEPNTQKEENEQTNKKNKLRMGIVLAFTAVVILVTYVILRGSYLEILELGEQYIESFWTNLEYMVITYGLNFVIVYALMYKTNKAIKKGLEPFFKQENKPMPRLLNKSISFIIAIIVSAVTSNLIMQKAMLCFNATSFEMTEPIFGLDIGYFIFIEPFIQLILWYAIVAVIGLTIYSAGYYIITFNMFFDGIDRETLKNSKLIKQLMTNIMILAIFIAGLVFVNAQDIESGKFITVNDMTETSYSLYGAGITDVTIKLWGYRILSIIIIISVYMAIKHFKAGKTKNVILSIGVVPAYLVVMVILLAGFNLIYVNSNEYDKQKQYIEYNISATKSAYGINIDEISLEDSENITSEDIENNPEVVNNIAIVSEDLVLKDLQNSQTAKGYYTYTTTQLQKYNINGETKLLYVSPREIVSSSGTYNNKTYEYTHGYGVVATLATDVQDNGTLNHIQKDFDSSKNSITITEPRIYYGLQTNDTVVTNSNGKSEFDYPILDSNNADNAENTYDGEAGLTLNFIDRVILAIKEGDLNLAFSSNVKSDSKILTNRNIIKRAQTIMPYLQYDEDPYLVVTDDGKMIWVLDAYTTSNNYPYSQKTTIQETVTQKKELNYIRNSVKVLIDAYDGTITFYITDKSDPIAMAYKNIYPNIFTDEEIPVDIVEHFVYPEYLYEIQSQVLQRYHNVQPDVLYRGDDTWSVATHNASRVITKTGTQIEPYYTMVNTVDSENAELGLVLPYTQQGKQSLISYLIGTYDTDGNAKLTIYKYSANSNILGPMQLDTQIEQDETISKEIENLNVTGMKIIKNMIMVPIENDVIYVEPIYQQNINEGTSLPTLKKVVVASGSKVAIGDTLKEALAKLVSKYAVEIEVENTDSVEDLVNAIIRANKNLSTSNSSNDWEMMGKDIQKLQDLIAQLEEAVEEENIKRNEIENMTSTTTNSIDSTNDINGNLVANVVE